MSRFVNVARLRDLCGAKGFAIKKTIGGRRWRLIDLELGHAIMHPDLRRPGWSMKEAVVYLRHFERAG